MHSYPKYLRIAAAIACIACGILLIFNPSSMANSICRIIGVIALVIGICELADSRNANARSIILVVIGAVLLLMPGVLLRFISIAAGLIIAVLGLKALTSALEARSACRPHWQISMGIGIAGIALGVVMFLGGINIATLTIRIIGAVIVVAGARILLPMLPPHN